MKKIQLLSILILFISFFGVQYIHADEPTGISSDNCLTFNNISSISPNSTLNINSYPCNNISFDAYYTSGAITEQRIKITSNSNDNHTIKLSRNSTNYNKSISTSATSITIKNDNGAITKKINNIKVQIAPHTKLNTKSLSFNTALTDPDGETKTVDFYSFLTGGSGMTISIVDVKDKDGNPITIEGLSLSRTRVEANILEKIGENNYSFTLKFEPEEIITNATCSIKITNQGVGDIYIPVTLSSTPEVPTLKLDASGYTFAKLSWNVVTDAEAYKLYDGNNLIDTYTTTSATITGLAYGSTHNYTVTSIKGSAESNKSRVVEVNCPAYPQVQNVNFSNVEQNKVTVNWNPVTISPANHSLVRYHVHFYENAAGTGTTGIGITTTGTSWTFEGLIDQTQYTAYVDVEYQYTLNEETKNVHEERWSSNSVTTASFIPSTAFDGVERVQGEWYRMRVNHNDDITDATYSFSLNYPCEKLRYSGYLNEKATNEHTITVTGSPSNKEYDKTDLQDKEDNYVYTSNIIDLEKTDLTLKFTGKRGDWAFKDIYINNIYAKIAPHILIDKVEGNVTKTDDYNGIKATATSTKSIKVDFGSMRYDANEITATINIKSLLAIGKLSTNLSNNPNNCFTIEGAPSSDGTKATFYELNTKSFTVKFNPKQFKNITTTQTITETITISDAGNTGNNVVIYLTAKVNPPKSQTITWPEFTKTLRIGDVITLNATATSGLDITYTSNNTNIATINGDKMTIVGAGEATITASQGGNAEYAAAPEKTKTITTKQYNVSNLRSTETGYKYIKLSWDAIDGADSYSIYEGDTHMGTITETNYTITGVTYSESHTYKIKTNDAQSYTTQSSGSETTITTPAYPQIQNIRFTDLQQNQVTVNWNPANITPKGHSIARYHIHLYQPSTAGTFIKNYTTNETSYTIKDLIDNTEYTVYIDVEYQYTLNGNTITDTDWPWSSASFTTTSFITNDPFIGVKMYKGAWYYVNLNNDINITSNPMPIKLGYPCNYLTFKTFTKKDAGAVTTGNSVGVKQDITHTYTTENWSFSNDEYTGETKIETTTSAISIFKNSGSSNVQLSPLEVKNIWLTIEPHILLKENRYLQKTTLNATKTATSTAEINFGTIEVDYNQQVNVNFKSFLSVGDIKATITEDNDNVFSLKDGTKELHIAGNNTLEDIYSNDHSFTITFTPNKAQNEEYSGTLVINDDRHTVIITLKGKCIKRTPEITWINDKYISLGEYLAGAAFSTCGTVKYKLVDETKNNIIGIDNDLNLLEGKEIGENVEIIAMVDESEKWYSTQSIATFTVTDKIIQAIKWNQDFTILKTINQKIELTAEAITRETGEGNGNEITYSITDEKVAIIDDGNKLQIKGSGYTYITAHQQDNDEYAPTYMTKLVFVIATAGDSENCLALEDIKGETYGDGGILSSGFDWGPFEFERELKTLGDKLSFETTKVTDQTLLNTTGDYLVITDDLGNLVYNSNLGKTETNIQLPDPEAKKLYFTLGGNLKVSISDIKVTPAEYITPDKNSIAFSETKVDNRAVEEIDFEWANQPDFVIAKIEDDEAGVFSIDNKTAVFGNPDCGKHGISTVKVIFSPKEETDYTANLVVYVGDEPEPEKIPITGRGKKAEQAIYWLNITNLTTADKEVNLAYTTASSQQEITYTFISGDDVIEISNNSITVLGEGTFTLKAQQKNNNSYYDTKEITKTFTASIGNIIFDNKANNNDWNTNGNWKPNSKLNLKRNITPSANVNAVISAEAVMSETNGEINNLTFETNGKLTIGATSSLKANEVNGATADNLILEASDKGNATFIYNSGTPSATVKMYSKATGAVNNGTPQWQYIGVAVDGATTSNFPNAWLLKWTEAENVTGDPWSDTPLATGTQLDEWAGYSISQPSATTYTTQGALMREDKTFNLSYTQSTDPDCGFNLLANSYTAPIDITKLTTSDFVNADACIILYNTGTYADWESQQGKSDETPEPGQLTVIPIKTVGATGLPKTIPSMQAFFVKANTTSATFTVNYDTDVAGATNKGNQMRAPQAHNEFNVLKIMIEGENTRDRLYLLENEETSKAYDNGYEARKIFDAPRGHQMYATCEYGYASIDCSESFVGQTIGLKGDNEGEMLTISFDIDRLEGYESLYLYDKVTGKYVNIVAGEKYTFFGVKGADDNRFSIVTNPDDRNQTPPFVVIGEELAFDKSQINADNANIYIYDTSGRLLIIDKVNPYENYNIPNMPKGIYLVSMNGYTTKIVKK